MIQSFGGNSPHVTDFETAQYAASPERQWEQVLIHAPYGRDNALIGEVLAKVGAVPSPCETIAHLAEHINLGAGAALIADETLDAEAIESLLRALNKQPPWSDFPILVMTRSREASEEIESGLGVFSALGNVTLLERPLRIPTLVSSIQSALRARTHQYRTRAHLEEQKRTAEVLKESEARLQFALSSARLGAWELDLGSGDLRCSDECKKNFGLAPDDQLSYAKLLSLIHPDDLPSMRDSFERAQSQGAIYEAEYRIRVPDGSERWIYAAGRTTVDRQGHSVRMAGVTMDVTGRCLAGELVRSSEEQLRTLANAMPQLAWMAKPEGAIFWYNQRWYGYTGAAVGSLDGWKWQRVVDPDLLSEFTDEWERCLATATPFEAATRLRGADGQFRWFLSRSTPLIDSAGRVLRWFGTCTDIDQQKQSESALRRHHRRLELLSGVATDLLRFNEPDKLLASVFQRLSTQSKADLCLAYLVENDVVRLAYSAGLPKDICERLPLANYGQIPCHGSVDIQPWSRQQPFLSDDESVLLLRSAGVVDYHCCPLLSNGKLLGTVSFGTRRPNFFELEDVELQRTIADQVAVALDRIVLLVELAAKNARFASTNSELARANTDLEQFAFSASHDLREPLRHMSIYSEMLQRRVGLALDPDSRQFLSFVIAGAHRMDHLVRDLLAYTQIAHSMPVPETAVDSNRVLQKVLGNLSEAIRASSAHIDSESLPALFLQEIHLVQLFQNLIENAIKYHEPGISPRIQIYSKTGGNGSLRICIQDNGIGIEPKYKDRIFGIFKRLHTCDKYEGTGIGLALCQKIVERYNGQIWVESEAGKGALFCFELGQETHDSQCRTATADISR